MDMSERIRGTLDILATLCMICASLAIVWTVTAGRSQLPSAQNAELANPAGAAGVENLESSGLAVRLPLEQTLKIGSPRIAVVEFSDFDCPYCGRHARDTFPRLRAELVERSKIAYAFVNFPIEGLHPRAVAAAQAATCAGTLAGFWPMHDLLFRDQRARDLDTFYQYADQLRLDQSRFRPCVAVRSPQLERDEQEGQRLGIRATPTFLVGPLDGDNVVRVRRRISGAVNYEVFKTVIEGLSGNQGGA